MTDFSKLISKINIEYGWYTAQILHYTADLWYPTVVIFDIQVSLTSTWSLNLVNVQESWLDSCPGHDHWGAAQGGWRCKRLLMKKMPVLRLLCPSTQMESLMGKGKLGWKKGLDSGDNCNLESMVVWKEISGNVRAAMPFASVGALCFIWSKLCQITTIIVSYLFVCTGKNQKVNKQDAIRSKRLTQHRARWLNIRTRLLTRSNVIKKQNIIFTVASM